MAYQKPPRYVQEIGGIPAPTRIDLMDDAMFGPDWRPGKYVEMREPITLSGVFDDTQPPCEMCGERWSVGLLTVTRDEQVVFKKQLCQQCADELQQIAASHPRP